MCYITFKVGLYYSKYFHENGSANTGTSRVLYFTQWHHDIKKKKKKKHHDISLFVLMAGRNTVFKLILI